MFYLPNFFKKILEVLCVKKIFAALVLFSMIFSLIGCGGDNKKIEKPDPEVKKVEQQKLKTIYDGTGQKLIENLQYILNDTGVVFSEVHKEYEKDETLNKDFKYNIVYFKNSSQNSFNTNNAVDMKLNDDETVIRVVIYFENDVDSGYTAGTILGATLISMGVSKEDFQKFFEESSKYIIEEVTKQNSISPTIDKVFYLNNKSGKKLGVGYQSKDEECNYMIFNLE